MSFLNIGMLIGYLILMLIIGFYASKVITTDAKDFWIGGQRVGLIPAIGTMMATVFSSSNMIGWTGWVYNNGWSSNWSIAGTLIATLLFTVVLAGPIRKLSQVTVPDIMEMRYDKKTELASAGVYIFESTVFLIANITAMGIVLHTLLGLPLTACIWISSLVIIAYTVMGGFFAVAYTDVLQIAIALTGFAISVFVALKAVGGFSSMNLQVASISPALVDAFQLGGFPISLAIGYQVLWGLSNITQGQVLVRIAAAKTVQIARIALIATAIMYFVTYIFGNPILGLTSRIMLPGISNPDLVYTTFVSTLLPPLAAAFIMCAIAAAVMSTCDSVLLYLSSVITRNIIQKRIRPNATDQQLLKMSRICVVVVGLVVAILAQIYPATIQWMTNYRNTVLGAALTMPILLGIVWRRVSPKAGLPGMIGGVVSALIWWHYGWPIVSWLHPILVGIGVSLIIMATITFAFPLTEGEKKKIDLFYQESKGKSVV